MSKYSHILFGVLFFLGSCSRNNLDPKSLGTIKIVEFNRVFSIDSSSTYDEHSYSVLNESHAKIILGINSLQFNDSCFYIITKSLTVLHDSNSGEIIFKQSKVLSESFELWECGKSLRCMKTPPLDFIKP